VYAPDFAWRELTTSHRAMTDFVMGSIAGSLSMTMTYPLEVVRRLQQVGGRRDPTRMWGFWEIVKEVKVRSGWRGFYVGLGLGLMKQTPMNAVSLMAWGWAKRKLGI
jgi:solute carrier family 25 (mitochondrial carrier protein), member 16